MEFISLEWTTLFIVSNSNGVNTNKNQKTKRMSDAVSNSNGVNSNKVLENYTNQTDAF